MPSIQTRDGVRLHYEVRGAGPLTLLFMHGWAGSAGYFDQLLEHLDLAGARAVTMDLRGHGDSSQPESGYTDEQLGTDALTVADAVGAKQFVAVGFSMSGRFVQYVPLLAPDRVRGLVLVAPCPATPIPFPAEMRRDWVARAGAPERLAEVTAMFLTQPVEASVLRRLGRDAAKASRTALDATLGLCTEASFADRLGTIGIPVLVVGGIHDSISPPEVLRQTVAAPLRRAHCVFLNANHEIPIEQPRELAAVIGAFVAGLAA
jgi:pimeloyl-ACP methyl ester carboxylesterase